MKSTKHLKHKMKKTIATSPLLFSTLNCKQFKNKDIAEDTHPHNNSIEIL